MNDFCLIKRKEVNAIVKKYNELITGNNSEGNGEYIKQSLLNRLGSIDREVSEKLYSNQEISIDSRCKLKEIKNNIREIKDRISPMKNNTAGDYNIELNNKNKKHDLIKNSIGNLLEKSLVCISKDECNSIDNLQYQIGYSDEDFNNDYGLSIKQKNDLDINPIYTENLKYYPYIFINYIEKSKLDLSIILERLIDLHKCKGLVKSDKEKLSLDIEIEALEKFISNSNPEELSKINLDGVTKEDFQILPARIHGIIESSLIYEENVILSASRGHGFAAEKANHLWDVITGKNAKIVGGDNAKNGADRLVDGISIQTKYCNTGSKCITECFENDTFRYMNPNGTPMQIEVPSDKYDSAVQAMEERIKKGQVPGVTDPKEAKNIVRKGNITYVQARNIAKFGTIESLTYDTVNGIKLASTTAGLSAVITFSYSLWNGENWQNALEKSCYAGLKVGGIAWASSIISSQVGRTGVEQSLRSASDWVVKSIGYKASAVISNAIRSGKDIYGAAATNYLSKVLRGNVVTGVITTTVISSVDFYQLFKGKISGAQALKNVTVTASSVAGGTGGWLAGAAAGAAIGSAVPIIGTAAGGIVGGILGSFGGGWAANKTAKYTMDLIIKDDAEEMVEIIQSQFSIVANDYLLSRAEAESIINKIKEKIDNKLLMNMYASKDHKKFAYSWMEKFAQELISSREKIKNLPSSEEIINETKKIIIKSIDSEIESDVIILKYDGRIPGIITNSICKWHNMYGLIIPSNYNCPIYETDKFNLYAPFDCMVIESIISVDVKSIEPGSNLLKVVRI